MPDHINSEGERIEVTPAPGGVHAGRPLLVIHDDPPPQGSGRKAPMLLDAGTRDWLLSVLRDMEDDDV